jgi:hypothetical protein
MVVFLSKGCDFRISWTLFFAIPVTSAISWTMTLWSSVWEVLDLPLFSSGSLFSAVRPFLNLLHHRDTSFPLKAFWQVQRQVIGRVLSFFFFFPIFFCYLTMLIVSRLKASVTGRSMNTEQLVKRKVPEETKVLGGNLSQSITNPIRPDLNRNRAADLGCRKLSWFVAILFDI